MRVRTYAWHTGEIPDRRGARRYTEMIRAPGDPERSSREARRAKHGRESTTLWRKELKKHPSLWGPRILELLKDGRPRTLNAISVELVDYGADFTAGRALGEALWALVEAGAVEHTLKAPIRFRWRSEPVRAPDYEAAARRVARQKKDEGEVGKDGGM